MRRSLGVQGREKRLQEGDRGRRAAAGQGGEGAQGGGHGRRGSRGAGPGPPASTGAVGRQRRTAGDCRCRPRLARAARVTAAPRGTRPCRRVAPPSGWSREQHAGRGVGRDLQTAHVGGSVERGQEGNGSGAARSTCWTDSRHRPRRSWRSPPSERWGPGRRSGGTWRRSSRRPVVLVEDRHAEVAGRRGVGADRQDGVRARCATGLSSRAPPWRPPGR